MQTRALSEMFFHDELFHPRFSPLIFQCEYFYNYSVKYLSQTNLVNNWRFVQHIKNVSRINVVKKIYFK
jgi:hypothetical protein